MQTDLFARFSPVIRQLTTSELEGAPTLFGKLTLAEAGPIRVCYAPFEFINRDARLVIVGITPGRTQMLNALREARRQLDLGADQEQVLLASKRTGGFSGAMRPLLVEMLDCVGVHRWLRLRSSSDLFGTDARSVQTASALRNPVFVDSGNYNGSPDMTKHPVLREHLLAHFGQDVRSMSNAYFLALGDKVGRALEFFGQQGRLDRSRVLGTLPHPSPANAERIAYFVGRKSRASLSAKTTPAKLDESRDSLTRAIAGLALPA